jgi:hypothetical protein
LKEKDHRVGNDVIDTHTHTARKREKREKERERERGIPAGAGRKRNDLICCERNEVRIVGGHSATAAAAMRLRSIQFSSLVMSRNTLAKR